MPREIFTVIPGLKGKGVDVVAAGSDYCVAVTESAEVYSWGGGGFGPLGHPKLKPPEDDDEMEEYMLALRDLSETEGLAHLAPRLVERLRGEGIVDLAAGYNHVAAVSDAGDVWTWGIGLHGQLGHGDLENQAVPKLIARLQEKVMIAVSVGHSHSICISDEDLPYCWGFTHGGRLGLGVLERQDPNPRLRRYFPTPTLIPFFRSKKVLQIACSANHTLALVRDENQVYSWGCGDGGRLGHGDADDRGLPTPIDDLRGVPVLHVSCGPWHSVAVVVRPPLLSSGVVYTWGCGTLGQLGLDGVMSTSRPKPVTALCDRGVSIKQVACGTSHCAAISDENVLYAWGSNKYGCLGAEIDEEFSPVPRRVNAFDVMIAGVGRGAPRAVTCGHDFTIVACFPYTGPSEEELIEMEGDKLHEVQKVAIMEAEKELKRLAEDEEKKTEARKRAGFGILAAKPKCDLCEVCSGFDPNIFKPSVCKECGHLKVKHTRMPEADEDSP